MDRLRLALPRNSSLGGLAEEVEAVNTAWKAGDRPGAVKGISARVLDGLDAVGSADVCRE